MQNREAALGWALGACLLQDSFTGRHRGGAQRRSPGDSNEFKGCIGVRIIKIPFFDRISEIQICNV